MIDNLLLTGGPAHDFEATTDALVHVLGQEGIRTTVVTEPAAAFDRLRAGATGAGSPFPMFTVNALHWAMETPRYAHLRADHAYRFTDEAAAALDAFVRGGGALLAVHAAVICFDGHPGWRALCGATWAWGASDHPPCGPVGVEVTRAGRRHEITAGLDDFEVDDEVYGFLDEVPGLVPLLTSGHGGRQHPLLWAREVGDGRVVTDLLGHTAASIGDESHATVLRRAARWAARVPVDVP